MWFTLINSQLIIHGKRLLMGALPCTDEISEDLWTLIFAFIKLQSNLTELFYSSVHILTNCFNWPTENQGCFFSYGPSSLAQPPVQWVHEMFHPSFMKFLQFLLTRWDEMILSQVSHLCGFLRTLCCYVKHASRWSPSQAVGLVGHLSVNN